MATMTKTKQELQDDLEQAESKGAALQAELDQCQARVAELEAELAACGDGMSIPSGELPEGCNQNPLHVDFRATRIQSNKLRKVRLGLVAQNATCYTAPGRRRLVDSNQDAVRWLLENLPE